MLFDRAAYFDIGHPGKDGLRVKNLRIAFEIEKSVQPYCNTAKVSIYNLADGTRTKLHDQYQRFALFAGYAQDDVLPLVFSGDSDAVAHRRLPPEWVSEVRVGDGRKALRETRLSMTRDFGCSAAEICRHIAQEMDTPIADESVLDDLDEKFPGGFAFTGQAEEAMRLAADAAGLEWSIQNGSLYFLPRHGTRDVKAFRLSAETGLIDAPERVVKPQANLKLNKPLVQWTARCLLNPRIEPGMPVVMDSETVRGVFRVEAQRHVGDTHGNDWFTELELGVYGRVTPGLSLQ